MLSGDTLSASWGATNQPGEQYVPNLCCLVTPCQPLGEHIRHVLSPGKWNFSIRGVGEDQHPAG